MYRRIGTVAIVGTMILGLSACDSGSFPGLGKDNSSGDQAPEPEVQPQKVDIGNYLYKPTVAPNAPEQAPTAPMSAVVDPVVIHDARLNVFEKEDVPSQQDGVLVFVGTPIQPGEQVPPGREVAEISLGTKTLKLRQLKEDDPVVKGQLLAIMDNRLASADEAIKVGKLKAGEADAVSADKTREEAKTRYETQLKLFNSATGRSTSREDLSGAKLTWDVKAYEAVSKKEAVGVATEELNQSRKVLEMHEIHSSMDGRIKTINRLKGESVKKLDPVFVIQNIHNLRAEGTVPIQQAAGLRKGMKAEIEPVQLQSPQLTLTGHFKDIKAVAVSKDDKNPLICSASEDGTVRVWDRSGSREIHIWKHTSAVRAVACTSPQAAANLCLTGTADGKFHLWNLDAKEGEALLIKSAKSYHIGAIRCVAFSPDGKAFATGGEDGQIMLWSTDKQEKLYTFPQGHRTTVTSLQFTPRSQLVSAGRDNQIRVWTVGDKGARQDAAHTNRIGDVTQVGVSPDGSQILFDQGKTLRVLSLATGKTLGIIENHTGASNFRPTALFSPDGKLILTASAAEGRLQLWRNPLHTTRRGSEVRQFVLPERAQVSCAAFSPNGNFLVTGGEDRQVLVWSMPTPEEVERKIPAEIALVDPAVESTAGQVRVRAEFINPEDRLLPGTSVTLVIDPRQ